MEPVLAPLLIVTWSALCALQDARQGCISHWLTYPAMAAAALFTALAGQSLLGSNPGDVVSAFIITLALTLPGYSRGHFGAGDIKMLLALSLASGTLFVLLIVALAGLGLALWATVAVAVWARIPAKTRHRLLALAPERAKLAYGPFMFGAAVIALVLLPHPLPELF